MYVLSRANIMNYELFTVLKTIELSSSLCTYLIYLLHDITTNAAD